MDPTTINLDTLPDPAIHEILMNASLTEIGRYAQLSHRAAAWSENEHFWRERYLRDFGSPLIPMENWRQAFARWHQVMISNKQPKKHWLIVQLGASDDPVCLGTVDLLTGADAQRWVTAFECSTMMRNVPDNKKVWSLVIFRGNQFVDNTMMFLAATPEECQQLLIKVYNHNLGYVPVYRNIINILVEACQRESPGSFVTTITPRHPTELARRDAAYLVFLKKVEIPHRYPTLDWSTFQRLLVASDEHWVFYQLKLD